ncbi:GDP-mannose 4,6-dehydratase [Psychrobacter sp. AOP22-C1-C5]|uniref:GDP-mannose 4,6-dehydratase n=1 Tax=Psychrobacter sp. AOP22-C1-C5 TaxID=3457716 RepID=UPI004035AD34
MSQKVALICGMTGQDGSYLAQFLLSKGYRVWGTSRDATNSNNTNLIRLNIVNKTKLVTMDPLDFRSVLTTINHVEPDEIYYLAGQSSVGLSFELPSETIQSIVLGTLNILEACRMSAKPVRLYQAGSSECYGDVGKNIADESFPFKPSSPYAVAKASAYWLVDNYRKSYGLYACTGILFNHESPLRPKRFVTQKIIESARAISEGKIDRLTLGRIDINRDWGWAPEYIEAMWLMLQQNEPDDFIVATGHSHSLEEFISIAFQSFGLEWQNHIVQSNEFYRPSDIIFSQANPNKINNKLGWRAKVMLPQIIEKMIEKQYW